MGFQPGAILRDRYYIIKELGKGGWGITYLAEDLELPTKPYCVIKEITPSPYISLEQNRERFEYEANALYTLGSHSQIPQLFARFEQDQRFYLVQEYIKGQNLQEKFNLEYRLTQQQVIEFLLDILEVLKFVHQHQRIHRDCKPSNLIQREQDQKIVLIDFGAVKEISTLEYTPAGEFKPTIAIGTPGYMPAEQLSGNPQYNSDIYALGIIAIKAITGLIPPISSQNHSEVLNSMQIDSSTGEVIWKDLQNITKIFNLDSRLELILNKMVRYNFCDRYQQVTEVIADLKQLQSQVKPIILNNIQFTSKTKLLGIGVIGLITGILLTKILPALLFVPNTKDYPINFTEVCNSPIIKGEEFKAYQGSPEYINLKTAPHVWSVFRWKCIFSHQEDTQIRGINLNNYCAVKYRESGYKYEAYFKNFLDKNSWYCTNVGTKLEPILLEPSFNNSLSFGSKLMN